VGPHLWEKEVCTDGSEEESREEDGQEGREEVFEEEVRLFSSVVS
jgi:hypothetical protein